MASPCMEQEYALSLGFAVDGGTSFPFDSGFVKHYFHGYVYRADKVSGLSPDSEIVYIRDSQIGRISQTGGGRKLAYD